MVVSASLSAPILPHACGARSVHIPGGAIGSVTGGSGFPEVSAYRFFEDHSVIGSQRLFQNVCDEAAAK
jgi:hypothetical protein